MGPQSCSFKKLKSAKKKNEFGSGFSRELQVSRQFGSTLISAWDTISKGPSHAMTDF